MNNKRQLLILLVLLTVSVNKSKAQHSQRVANFTQLKQKMDTGDAIKVLYLGGSITEGAFCYPLSGTNKDGQSYDYTAMADAETYSWRALTYAWLKDNYETQNGQFTMFNAAVGDTHSELAAYRLEENVLEYNPDLIFVEFAINDNGKSYISNDATADNSIYRTMSSIVRRLEAQNPDIAICIPLSTSRNRLEPEVIAHGHHMAFANQMRIPYVDINDVYYNQTLPEGITTNNVFDGIDDAGNAVHPSPLGHQAYAEGVEKTLQKLLSGEGFTFTGDTHDFYTDYPEHLIFYSADKMTAQVGWDIEPGSEYRTSTHVLNGANLLSPSTEGAPFEITFKGKSVLIWSQYQSLQGARRGSLEVYVDDNLVKTFTSSTTPNAGEQMMGRRMRVIDNLDPDLTHTLKLVPKKDASGMMRMGFYGVCIDGSEVSGSGEEKLSGTMYIHKNNGIVLQIPIADIVNVALAYNDNLIQDADGNMYNEVVIGTQTWLDKPLITTHFNNGDPITNVSMDAQWSGKASSEPVMGFYQHTPEPWGGYYNSLVVLDERGVCPEGYHIPTKEEYETLIAYLGGGTNGVIAAPKLRSTENWTAELVGTNESGFNAPGSALRTIDGTYLYQTSTAFIWTSTLFDGGLKTMYTFVLDHLGQAVFYGDGYINKGHPIRCIKN